MSFKSLKSLLTCAGCKSQKYFAPKSRPSFLRPSFLHYKPRFYCSKNQKDSSDSSATLDVKQLLKSSSPLRLSAELDLDNEMWATSPYPEGTVFREGEPAKKPQNENYVSRSVIMFPGQGNQFVGMAKNLLKYPVAVDMFKTANEILNYDLLKICLEGPEDLLNNTKYCQPATFVCSLALLEKLKEEKPWAISNCWATCGYSLGELTALVFAGCVNFEKGLKLVKCRANAMALCSEKIPGSMLTIFTGPRTTLGKAFSDAIEECKLRGIENPQCIVASYLFPNCKVISGNDEAIKFIEKNAQNYNIRRHSRLPVSGAFHTLLMKDAASSFSEMLKNVNLAKPLIKVFSNVTGKPYKNEKDILKNLPNQIFLPVKWEQTVQNLFGYQKSNSDFLIYECGPGNSLSVTVKKINFGAFKNCFSLHL